MEADWKEKLAQLMSTDTNETEANAVEPIKDNEPYETALQKDPVIIWLDKKGRKGKIATIIEGFTISDEKVDEIASELKRKIGTGGSSRGGEILLQGDWRDKVLPLLKAKGFKVKRGN